MRPHVRFSRLTGLLVLGSIFFGLMPPAHLPLAQLRSSDPAAGAAKPLPVSADAAWPVDPRQREHLLLLGVKTAPESSQRGQGIKIAILDSGFRGYRNFLGKELPEKVQARSFRKDGNLEARDSQHGILCAEVIHTLAPAAELLFANWEPREPATFLEAIRWARGQGARLISCSCIMPNWSDGEGGGEVHQELARILGTGRQEGDVLFFGCVGNTAQRHWHGTYRPDRDGLHQWSIGEVDNVLSPWGNERVTVELYCRKGTATYELLIHDVQSGAEVARATSVCHGERCTATAGIEPQAGHDYAVRVRATTDGATGGDPESFHVVALHGTLGTTTRDGSICFPGDGRDVIAVGAVKMNGQRCSFSACGPNSPLPKPDLVAPVPFASRCRTQSFSGTSAATPQAAGLTALLWSRHPTWTADQVRRTLLNSARDLGPPGYDRETGYGLIRLPQAN